MYHAFSYLWSILIIIFACGTLMEYRIERIHENTCRFSFPLCHNWSVINARKCGEWIGSNGATNSPLIIFVLAIHTFASVCPRRLNLLSRAIALGYANHRASHTWLELQSTNQNHQLSNRPTCSSSTRLGSHRMRGRPCKRFNALARTTARWLRSAGPASKSLLLSHARRDVFANCQNLTAPRFQRSSLKRSLTPSGLRRHGPCSPVSSDSRSPLS